MKRTLRRFLGMISVMSALALASCTPKNVAYLQNIDDTITTADALSTLIRVKPEDKISIVVHSKDDQLSKLFNLPVVSTNITQAMTTTEATTIRNDGGVKSGMSVYTVSPEGTIQFPILGELKVAGMSRSELSGFIKGELMGRDLVKDPTVTVEFVNTGINVLGEVNSPGRIEVNRDHLTILDALAIAGDMTIHGQRENVMVIREENGQRKAYRIDMTDARKTMSSPAYYLQQNDIIYVEPNGQKKRETTTNSNNFLSTGFWISVASLLTSICVLIFR
jgi:polysaccharide export outer membrane protein